MIDEKGPAEFSPESPDDTFVSDPEQADVAPRAEGARSGERSRSGRPAGDSRRGTTRRSATGRHAGPSAASRDVSLRPARAQQGASPSQVRMRRLGIGLAILVLIVAALGYAAWSTLYRADAEVPAGQTVKIVIAQGASGDAVASQLAKAGVVTNAMMFRIQSQLLGATNDIKAGTYTFTTGSDYEPVIRMLQQGPPEDPTVTFTIPEGWGIDKTAARVEKTLGIPADEFVTLATTGAKQFDYPFLADDKTGSLEGYLFPKTYTVKEGTTATGVINVMLTQYGEETAGLDYSYARSRGLSPHDALTIASIIEREASVPGDRPKVASVIYNRLAIRMRLQLDSTVQYALHGKVKLTLADLQTDSPYNTYMNAGVPPGPICSPGIVAIKAALAPAKTDYLYYILTYKDGRQSFATNYADFLRLKAQYKRGLK